MDDPLIVALAITLVGMVLLFLALAFFYGLLSFIASALHEKEPPAPAPLAVDEAGQDQPAAAEDLMLQAAAIAVALARAEGDDGLAPVAAGPAGRALSPWWLLHQGRRMAASSSPWRTS